MQVILYNNRSDKRRLNKKIAKLATVDCMLKDRCSLLNPRLVISHAALSAFAQCNYMYIPDFNRYYFCSVSALTGDMLEITGAVDVLMSYRNGINEIRCTIVRQEKKFNKYFIDNFLPVSTIKNIQYVSVGTFSAGKGIYLTVDGGESNG